MRLVLSLLVLLTTPLVTKGANERPVDPEGLWQAAREGDVREVRRLLEAGVPVDAKTEFECTALYFAVNSDQVDVARVLLDAGADVNVTDSSYGLSALGMAAWLGHTGSVEVLLEAEAKGAIGSFFAAASNGHVDTVYSFLERKLIPQAQLDSALGMALGAENEELASALRTAGAKPPEASTGDGGGRPSQGGDEIPAAPRAPRVDLDLQKPIGVARAAAWPEFRGPGRSGVADGQHPPLAWNLESGRNVAWRAPVEGLGLSSPVIFGDRVFLTTAISARTEQTVEDGGRGLIDAVDDEEVEHRWEVHAYSLASGKLLWKRTATEGVPRSQRHWKASQANSTCATDGKVLIASFGSEGVFAFDLDGKPLWRKELGVLNPGWFIDPAFEWGYASSPILHDGQVIVQSDLPGTSFVVALDAATGEELWRTERDELPSWGTPLVHRGKERAELVLNASNAIVGYDPATGSELWRIRGNSKITVASPVAVDGAIVATGGYRTPRPIYVVKPGASGDITPPKNEAGPSILWSSQTDGVYVPTPLIYRGLLYMGRDNGVLTAFDLETGEELYRRRLQGRYTASPVAADGRIYFTNESGDVVVIAAEREFRVLAQSELDAPTLATPAISNGMIVFRTVKELVGIGLSGGASARDQTGASP